MTTTFTLSAHLDAPFDAALAATRDALAEQGFGVITEIDMQATMKAKLGVDLPPQVILGACRPQLAYEALQASPSVATLLPCNVVVRSAGEQKTIVEAFDPATMSLVAHDPSLEVVATDARTRLVATLERLTHDHTLDPTHDHGTQER